MKTKRTSENVRVLSETESVCVSCGRVSILKSFRIPAIILHSCRIIVIDALNIGLGMPEIAIYYDEDKVGGSEGIYFPGVIYKLLPANSKFYAE